LLLSSKVPKGPRTVEFSNDLNSPIHRFTDSPIHQLTNSPPSPCATVLSSIK
jgi:hypothetical protein